MVHGVAGRVVRDERGAFRRDHVAVGEGVEIELVLESPVELPRALDEPVVSDQLLLRPLRGVPAQGLPRLRLLVRPLQHGLRGHGGVLSGHRGLVARRPVLELEVWTKPTLPHYLVGREEVVRIGELADQSVRAIARQQALQPTVVVVVHVRDQDLLQSFDAVRLHALVQGLHETLVAQILLARIDEDPALARAYQVAASAIQREGGGVER
mmetsp:Transcript_23572/g.47721  ORF Transcript_23572/g.47721 Transcript_23572/m.47721 type:complete len:211 (+) Transcript_23572:700-1332(+)